jgi:hypothetical protein
MFYKWQKEKKPKVNYQCIIMMDHIVNTLQNTKKIFQNYVIFWYANIYIWKHGQPHQTPKTKTQ